MFGFKKIKEASKNTPQDIEDQLSTADSALPVEKKS